MKPWRNRYNVFRPFLEGNNHVSFCHKHLNLNIQSLYLKLSSSLSCVAQSIFTVMQLILSYFLRFVVTPILVCFDPDCSAAQTSYVSDSLVNSSPDCSTGMVAQSPNLLVSFDTYYATPRTSHQLDPFMEHTDILSLHLQQDVINFLNDLSASEKFFALMNVGPCSTSILEKIPILQLTKSAGADHTRKWCEHCPATEMIADNLTKPLQGYEFTKMRDLLLGHNRHEFAMKKWNWKLWGVLEIIMFLLIFYLTGSRSKTAAVPVWSSVYLPRPRSGVCLSVSISHIGFWRRSGCTVRRSRFNIWIKPFTIFHINQTLYKR